jgi:hypothetical protein
MGDTVCAACTFASSGRSTCAPNALEREKGLHLPSLGIVIWMLRTMPHGSV